VTKKIITLLLALCMTMGFSVCVNAAGETYHFELDFENDHSGSDDWIGSETHYYKDGRLIMALKPDTEDDDNAWGLFNCRKSFGKVTFQADIDNLVPNGAGQNFAWLGLRLRTESSMWNEGIWFGFCQDKKMRVKANSSADGGVTFDIPVNFTDNRTVKITDDMSGVITAVSFDENGKEILLCKADSTKGNGVEIYDCNGELKYTFDTTLNAAGGYIGIMCHYIGTAIDNIVVDGAKADIWDIVKASPPYSPTASATVGGTQVNKIFKDIDHVEWAWEGIAALNARGVVAGTSATTYEPDGVLTREQFIKMAVGAFDLIDTSATTSFGDVAQGEWYCSYVASAEKAGLLEGIYSGNLGVGQPISREDMSTIAARALDKKNLKLDEKKEAITFKDDGKISAYAKEPVYRMYKAGIINGMTETTFEPQSSCTRAMAAKVLCGLLNYYPQTNFRDTMADTWVGVDDLGRPLLTYKDTRAVRDDKAVGMFYYLGHGESGYLYDSSKEFAKPREERNWIKGASYMAQEPYLGYYQTSDEYVIRKHMQMFADMGVDFLYFDCTNHSTFPQDSVNIMKVLREMMNEGKKVPQIVYTVHTNQKATSLQIFTDIYAKNMYPETWFYWDGKPLMLADGNNMPEGIEDYFTTRFCWAYHPDGITWTNWWNDGTNGKDKWPWLAKYPQPFGWHEAPTKPEQLVISAAEHANTNIGKSWTSTGGTPEPLRTNEGLYFAEQISRLDEVDPEVLMITQWNEKRASIMQTNGTSTLGNEKDPDGWYFVDAMAEEWNRDIEPVKDSYGDNYYYQAVNAVRKFRGVRPYPSTDKSHSITIGKDFGVWANVEEIYYDDIYDIPHRNFPAKLKTIVYTDTTGRNDFVESRAARDESNLYFYVKTRDNLTPVSETDKMHTVLLLNTDGNYETGWHGYDYLIGRARNGEVLSVEKNMNNKFTWKIVGTAPYVSEGNEKHLSVPKELLEISGNTFTVDFKWADNQPENLEIMDFIDKGDAAPNGRFNYRFEAK